MCSFGEQILILTLNELAMKSGEYMPQFREFRIVDSQPKYEYESKVDFFFESFISLHIDVFEVVKSQML